MPNVFNPRRAIAAVAIGTAAIIATSACDSDEVGAAAVIGDNRITMSELQDMTREVADRPGSPFELTGDLTDLQSQLLQQQVQNDLTAALADAEGISVSEADVDKTLDEEYVSQTDDFEGALIQNGFTKESLRDAVRAQLQQQQLLQRFDNDQEKLVAAYGDTAKELGVKINPRYGTWKDVQLEQVSGSVSKALEGTQQEGEQQQEGQQPDQREGEDQEP